MRLEKHKDYKLLSGATIKVNDFLEKAYAGQGDSTLAICSDGRLRWAEGENCGTVPGEEYSSSILRVDFSVSDVQLNLFGD